MKLLRTCVVLVGLAAVSYSQVTAPQGAIGPKGEPGLPGPLGLPGITGDRGEKGTVGEPGPTGSTGATGNAGLDGTQGFSGAPGMKGDMGDIGATGLTGVPGDSGEHGAAGVMGATGATGAAGNTGSKGQKGEFGVAGGPGEKGSLGERGFKGDRGIVGENGIKGSPGLTGPKGFTPYEIRGESNECNSASTNNCDQSTTTCVALTSGYKCVCLQGYQPINDSDIQCEDINECSFDNGGCSHICTNNVGSFQCSCPEGLESTVSGVCIDSDECADNSQCGDLYCVNTYGNYTCATAEADQQATTPVAAPVAQALTVELVRDSVYVGLIIWLSIITLAIIIIILRLIYVFHDLRKNQQDAMDQVTNSAFDNLDSLSDHEGPSAQLGEQSSMVYSIPWNPASRGNTVRGQKGSGRASRSYNAGGSAGSRGSSLSSATGKEVRTASVRSTRVASGERTSVNRLSGVDTFY